jgi:hypothetical protein
MTKTLNISFFKNYHDNTAIEKELTIDAFCSFLQQYLHKTEQEKYNSLDIEKVKSTKILGFIPLLFDNKHRKIEYMSISKRCMITIDIDSYKGTLDELKQDLHNKFSTMYYAMYTTAKSTYDNPRVRLIFFLKDDFNVTTKTEQSLYSKKIKGFCKKYFGEYIVKLEKRESEQGYITTKKIIYDNKFEIDDASFQSNRLMLLPFFYDSERLLLINEGELVDLGNIEIEEKVIEKVRDFNKYTIKTDNTAIEDDRNIAELANLLTNLHPSELSYEEWINVGYVIKYEFCGSEKGEEVFAKWSLQDNRYSSEEIIRSSNASYKSMPDPDAIAIRRYYIYLLVKRIANAKRKELDVKVSYYPIPKHLFPDVSIKKDGNLEVKTTYANFEYMLNYYNTDIYLDLITKQESSCFADNEYSILSLVATLVNINAIKSLNVCLDIYLKQYILERAKNPWAAKIKATKWDGVDRLTDFCNTITLVSEEKDYINKLDFLDEEERETIIERKWLAIKMKHVYIKTWLKQMIYMHMNIDVQKKSPRYLLCLQGKEFIGKTYWTRSLVPSFFPACYAGDGATIDLSNDSNFMKVIKYVFVELGELGNTLRRIGIDRFKQIFSSATDTLNLKYAKRTVDYPRLTSFIATLNDTYFLNNQDEHTRFLILNVSKMNGNHNIDMMQLYAQIYENEDWNNFELTKEEREIQIELNSYSVIADEMEELVKQYFLDAELSKKSIHKNYYSCVEILNIVGYRDANVKNSANRLAKLLTKLSYHRSTTHKKFLIVPRR